MAPTELSGIHVAGGEGKAPGAASQRPTTDRSPAERERLLEHGRLGGLLMTRKPARMYREIEGQVYTRQEYMGGIPTCRITQFDTGNLKEQFPVSLSLGVEEAAQVRDVALEAARISAVRVMDKNAANQFHLKVRRYPHQILREHKMAMGAGADRISDGMRRAFGKPVGHAVRAQIGAEVMTIYTTEAHVEDAREALRKASHKLPVPTRLVITRTAA
jgi:large subunit ribosomal protein L10e